MAMFHGARGLAVLLGPSVVTILKILLSPILGVPLIFAGIELANMVFDLKEEEDFFVVRVMFVTALAVNRGAAFVVGVSMAYVSKRLWLYLFVQK